jgi:hypothetical protein
VEVGGEGAGELRTGGDVHRGEALRGGLGVGADQGPDLLDEVEQGWPLLAGEGLAEQGAEPADVRPQRGVGPVVVMLVGHRALLTRGRRTALSDTV